MQQELGRSMSYYASLKVNAPTEERRTAMARAKYQLGNSMRFIGQQAVHLLRRRLKEPAAPLQTVVLQTRLIVRQSSGTAKEVMPVAEVHQNVSN